MMSATVSLVFLVHFNYFLMPFIRYHPLVASGHLLAYTTAAAANQRYAVAASSYGYQMFCDIIRAHSPDLRDSTPKGVTGQPLPEVYKVNNTKAKRDLGLDCHRMERTVVDAITSLMALEERVRTN